MSFTIALVSGLALFVPSVLILYAIALTARQATDSSAHAAWKKFRRLTAITALASLIAAVAVWVAHPGTDPVWIIQDWLGLTRFSVIFALLVQGLGLVISTFSARYLEGEHRQIYYITWLACVLGSVQVLIFAQHWIILITAWSAVGLSMQKLLCFYPDRPFALLAARKKQLADRIADLLLILAAGLIWFEVGQGSLAALESHLAAGSAGLTLQIGSILLVVAILIRTALLPAHGWLTQVMEAPTPVSALLHAGVVNLGGFVLIQLAPLLDSVIWARWILIVMGLATTLLAGLVILTRVSIKVRLAWSTIAQMGFMVLECGLGLYTLAALHLIGHSLYKAHAFLRASSTVQDTRVRRMHQPVQYTWPNLVAAPALALLITIPMISLPVQSTGATGLPIWWAVLLAMAWSPLFWQGRQPANLHRFSFRIHLWKLASTFALIVMLSLIIRITHLVPLGVTDSPAPIAGWVSALAMSAFYAVLVCMQVCPARLETLRRWSYAGFYVDELYTRMTLRLWPGQWMPDQSNRRTASRLWMAGGDRPTMP
ncbi:NADH-quinone oxidoreductase subunit L [Orrella marina]|uniref:Probable inorganic carbon transporter subunit DabB n=1 Tax=Orrella marina TaxID=2163011 RepID=A0A2R4XKL5_9BURK|nr:NADH-quinone oxidoreductase subunit L [Orrella marina]AWB34335.1 NADH-quinone oxidoreductase subunit L [Orrella marina]